MKKIKINKYFHKKKINLKTINSFIYCIYFLLRKAFFPWILTSSSGFFNVLGFETIAAFGLIMAGLVLSMI